MSMFLRKDLFMKILLRFLGNNGDKDEKRILFSNHHGTFRHITCSNKAVSRTLVQIAR